jgi:hypothetical protein
MADDKIQRIIRHRLTSPYLTTPQAADYLKISAEHLKRLRWKGRGPIFRRHGRYVHYHVDDLDAWSAQTASRGPGHD